MYNFSIFVLCLFVIRQHIIAASHDMRIHLFFRRFGIMLLNCLQNPSVLFDRYLCVIAFGNHASHGKSVPQLGDHLFHLSIACRAPDLIVKCAVEICIFLGFPTFQSTSANAQIGIADFLRNASFPSESAALPIIGTTAQRIPRSAA